MKILLTSVWLLPFLFAFGFASEVFPQNSLQCFVPGNKLNILKIFKFKFKISLV